MNLEGRVARAWARRGSLLPQTDAVRAVHGSADGLDGLVVEVYGTFAHVRFDRHLWGPDPADLCGAIGRAIPDLTGLYAAPMERMGEALRPAELVRGDKLPPGHRVVENGLAFRIIIGQGTGTGLYLDMRAQRRRLERESAGKRVLNLFCYTGSLGIACLRGGADRLLSVDLSRSYLRVFDENLVLNDLEGRRSRWLQDDVRKVLRRLERRGERFDLVLIDPPAFSRPTRGQLFRELDEYPAMARACWSLVSPSGSLLFATHHRRWSHHGFRAMVDRARAQAGVNGLLEESSGPTQIDFPGSSGALRIVWARVRDG